MNRTGIFLAAAGVLALAAVIAGLPRTHFVTPHDPIVKDDPGATVASDGSLKMSARLSHPYVGLGTSDEFVTVEVSGVDVPGATRAPVNLALVIDRSGSMSGYKLDQAKQAARQLISQLKDSDRLAIVHFGSDVKSLDGMFATEDNKRRMLAYVDGIWDDGGTNIGAGLTTGRDLLLAKDQFKVNRLILISDGQPTEGQTDSESLRSVAREIRAHGISLSSIGVGSDFNEDLMQAFAEIGAGSYGYLADASQLATVFSRDLHQAGTQVARNVTLTFELPLGVHLGEVLGYPASQVGSTVRVSLPDFSSGQLERIVARVVVNGARSGDSVDVSHLKLDYTDSLKSGFVESTAAL
ncbi:MAG TPA: VWA domain-containing protein, partial [Steroidobacteraceae bacterium]|nr:VWA domain-containing protein [Steroidobacteraceae bacterium]